MDHTAITRNTLPKNYVHKDVEALVHTLWEQPSPMHTPSHGVFLAPIKIAQDIHLGHLARMSRQDAYVRFINKFFGPHQFIPGIDHGGLSTEYKIDKELRAHNKSKELSDKEHFLKKAHQFATAQIQHIKKEATHIGTMLSWENNVYSMDKESSTFVQNTFVELYKQGLVYREQKVLPWCSHCQTVLGAHEVKHVQEEGKKYFIRYFLKAADKSIMISTTRPETILADVAIAVHPQDKNYKEFMDKSLILPILNKEIPVITDTRVLMDEGTGAISIAPGHNTTDYILAMEHALPITSVIGTDGKMNKNAGKFAGLEVKQARQNIVEYLDNIGNLETIEECEISTPYCTKCTHSIDYILSKQWFLKTTLMTQALVDSIEENKITILPEREKNNIFSHLPTEDLCISRNLLWGPTLPCYYSKEEEEELVTTEEVRDDTWTKDTGVIDETFILSLWPLLVEHQQKEINTYPTKVLEVGRDMIQSWVIPMLLVCTSLKNTPPVETLLVEGYLYDEDHERMSISKGNMHDIKHLRATYGNDVLRMTFLLESSGGKDIILSNEQLQYYQNFITKFWNGARFIMQQTSEITIQGEELKAKIMSIAEDAAISDQWIISRITHFIEEISQEYSNFAPARSYKELLDATWHEFFDWYLELSKIENSHDAPFILRYGLEVLLHLWHPIMPFTTEAIWHTMHPTEAGLKALPWPTALSRGKQEHLEDEFKALLQVVNEIRAMKQERGVATGAMITVYAVPQAPILQNNSSLITILCKLARLDQFTIIETKPTMDKLVSLHTPTYDLYIPLASLVDIEKEKTRLELCIKTAEKQLRILQEKLQNESFLTNAPETLVRMHEDKIEKQLAVCAKYKTQYEELL